MRKHIFFSFISLTLFALPHNPQIQNGIAHIDQKNDALNVQVTNSTIINWDSFSIRDNETVRFTLPKQNDAVLNRVTGFERSEILGALHSNGRLYLINPNGILFGKDAVIDTHAALFSTLDLKDKEFLSGDEYHFIESNPSKITNLGMLHADDSLILLSRVIDHQGTIDAKEAFLGASEEILVKMSEEGCSIRPLKGDGEVYNRGDISALKVAILGTSNPYSLAIHSDKSELQAVRQGGRIYLCSGNVKADEIEIKASQIEIQKDAQISADSLEYGDGGIITIIGNDLSFMGSASAMGGAKAGDGGFIEISGRQSFNYHPKNVSTFAPNGKTGSLLLDPNDIIIQLIMPTSGGFTNPYTGAGFNPAYIMIADLVGASGLLNNNVIVQTDAGTVGGSGDITIADPFSWAANTSLTLLPSRDLNVNALAQATGNGSFTVNAGRDVNVGTVGNTVPSSLKAVSGNVSITCVRDLSVQGGMMLGAYSEISSISGTITCNVGSDVRVLGGGGISAYAQIGVGTVTSGTAITSDIQFTSIGGDVILTGSAASNDAYAQIGHAPDGPGTHSVSSDVNFPNGGSMGLLTMTGNALNSTAIIGHGNEQSANLMMVSGNINVGTFNGITLTGGGFSNSHAIIGFHNPHIGSTFTCNSMNVTVQNFIMGDITLTAGTGSNAVIGYYNGAVGIGPNVTINSILVSNPINLNVNLVGGATGGISNGVAAIGTLANAGSTNSGITLSTGVLNMNAVAPILDGSARIVGTLPNNTNSFDVNITCGGLVGIVANILGGTTSASNFAEIYSGNNINLEFNGDLQVNTAAQMGFSQIVAASSVRMNQSSFGNAVVLEGSSLTTTGYALIEALSGSVLLGNTGISGAVSVSLGTTMSLASSRIVSQSGPSILNITGGDYILTGGTGGAMPVAEIFNNLGPITIFGRDLTLMGGSGMLAYAQIASNQGDMTFTIAGDVHVEGGSAVQAYAQIGKGRAVSDLTINSNIDFTSVSGFVEIFGGTATGAYAQIGHSPFDNISTIQVTGDVSFSPVGITNYLTLMGGSAFDATAILGFGNELTTNVSSYTSNIVDVDVQNNILLQTGSVARTHAIIGFHSPTTVPAAFLTIDAQNVIDVQSVNGTIVGNAGDGSNATIGYYNSTNMGPVTGTVQQINVLCNSSITFQAGNDGGTGAGVAAIGTFADNSDLKSNIQVTGTTVSFLGPTGGLGGNDGSARLVNHYLDFSSLNFPFATFDIQMNVSDLIVYGGTGQVTGFADVYSCQNFTCFFTNNFEVNSTVLQNGYAHVIANQDINMGSSGNLISVIGGAVFSADARIQSVSGQLNHGSFQGGGAMTINIGQANSLSTSQVITSTGLNNINSSANFSIQGGAGLNTVSLVRTDSGPFTVSAGGSMTITGGTGGNFASAEIRSLSGPGQVAAVGDMTLLGGGNTLCFAQINSDTGSINFPNIGNNLTLTGGVGTEAYAQIGKGFVAAATFVNSNLTFSNIGNNLTLNGSSMGASSYAQIGHSPFFSTFAPPPPIQIDVNGNVTISNVGGKTELNGGPGPASLTTAIIGHGNELTGYIGTCTGSITLSDSGFGGIELNPGAPLLNTHAVIGFHSPAIHPMNMVTFGVNSPLVSVTTSDGPIIVNGGDRSNAIIGYYNQTTPNLLTIGVDLTIDSISVNCSLFEISTNNITLFAGNDMGTTDGVAIIGTSVSLGNNATSNITIMGNVVNVFGPTGTNDGRALITNNRINEILPTNDVTFSNTNTITVFGNTSTMMGLAEVYSSGTMTLNFMKTFNVGFNPAAPATLATSNQLVQCFGNMTMNMNPSNLVGSIHIVGGAVAPILTEVSTLAGNILIGNTNQTAGAKDITVGSAAMLGAARMFTVTGDIFAQISGNTTLTGGMDPAAIANIESNTNLTLNAAGTVALLGGSVAGAVARVSTSFGKSLVFGKEGITATGGVAEAEFRQFGFNNSEMVVHSGKDITINANARVLNDGNGKTTVLAIGNLFMNGDAFIQNIGSGQLNTFSGVSSFFNDSSQVLAGGGDIAIVVDNDFPTPPGIGPGRFVTEPNFSVLTTGKVRIFTARRPQNSVQSLLNGNAFVPGIEYVDTATEKWRIYYFSSLGGVPFTIFYKEFIPIPVVPTIIINSISQVQFLQNLKTFDFPTLDFHKMTASFEFCKENPIGFCLEETLEYLFFRQLYLNYHTKSIDPLSPYW